MTLNLTKFLNTSYVSLTENFGTDLLLLFPEHVIV
jgi:hypothetical protein